MSHRMRRDRCRCVGLSHHTLTRQVPKPNLGTLGVFAWSSVEISLERVTCMKHAAPFASGDRSHWKRRRSSHNGQRRPRRAMPSAWPNGQRARPGKLPRSQASGTGGYTRRPVATASHARRSLMALAGYGNPRPVMMARCSCRSALPQPQSARRLGSQHRGRQLAIALRACKRCIAIACP